MPEDPVRLLDEGGSELMRSLLSAARDEQPQSAALRRTLAAVGVGGAVVSLTGSAAGATAGAHAAAGAASLGSAKGVASTAFLVAAKWLVVGAVAGAAATSAVYGVTSPSLPPPPAKVVTVVAPAVVARRPSAPRVAVERAPEPAVAVPAAPVVTSAVVAQPVASRPIERDSDAPLAAEVLALDEARQALAAGNAGHALQLLNGYETSIAKPRMLPEALYIRLEALTLQGDKIGSQAVARQLLRSAPSGPHAARARSVLGIDQ
jgi:hypothetical protein